MIGMLMPAIHDLHGEQWLGAVEAASAYECDLICFCGGELESERNRPANVIYELATAGTLDALVIWTSALATGVGQESLEAFFRGSTRIPFVAVEQPMFDAPVVRMGNQAGMCEAVSHLIEVHGCRRIAFVRGPGTVDAAVERYQGYLDALRQHSLAVRPELVSPHLRTWTPEESAAWVTDMLRAADVPDAIAASNDDLAAGVIHALETADLDHVPVIGFDDFTKFRSDELGFARGSDADASIRRQVAMNVNTVSLTTVHAPFQEMGRRSVEVALALIRGDPVSEESGRVPTELVVRRSCGCLPTVSPAMPAAAGAAGELATHLRQALTHPSDELPADWAERLMAAFVREMRGESSGAFARLLDSLIQLSMRSGEGAGDWSRVLFTLRPLIGSARNVAETVRAEDAWRRAHMLLTDTADRHHWRFMRALVETRNQVLREVGQQLITAADLDGLVRILPGQLSRVGIPGCYLALYEPVASGLGTARPAEPIAPGQLAAVPARLLIAYENGEPAPLDPDSVLFPSGHLVPGDRLRRTAPFSMVAVPLYFNEQQLGFALFELGPKIGWVYATLQEQLSSALHRLFMVERERAALAALEQIHRREERQRLASDLHDSVSQALFSMTLQTRALELALQQRGEDPNGRVGRGLGELKELTRGALAEMRALIFQLRPDALHEDGLIVAVRRHADAVADVETVRAGPGHIDNADHFVPRRGRLPMRQQVAFGKV